MAVETTTHWVVRGTCNLPIEVYSGGYNNIIVEQDDRRLTLDARAGPDLIAAIQAVCDSLPPESEEVPF